MMKNYNFKKNHKQPSSEDIAQHQDFDALLQQFSVTESPTETAKVVKINPLRRAYVWMGAAAAILLVGVLLYVGFGREQLPTAAEYYAQEELFFENQPYVNAPLPQVQARFANFKVQANQGGVFEYENGSKLVVPAEAFMNDRGQLIEGEVDIKYREFHDYVDFFLSGIPMVYDSAGIEYNLESAGMMEIYAEQNGVRVNMAPGKAIDVELISQVAAPNMEVPAGFNIYKLDEEERAWVYQTVDDIEFAEEEELFSDIDPDDDSPENLAKIDYRDALQQIEQRKITSIERLNAQYPLPAEPIQPRRRNGTMPSLELDFLDNLQNNDPASVALRKKYDGVVWQISPNSPPFNENAAQIIWEDFKLEQLNKRDFSLTLIKGDNELNILINPVLNADQYQQALAEFEQEFQQFEQAQADRQAKIAEQTAALEAQLAEERALAEATFEERIAKYQAAGNDAAATDEIIKRKVINRFRASSFGTWNCDRPLPPFVYELAASFANKKGQKYNHRQGYMVDKRRNTVQQFYVTDGARIRFDKNSDNLMWLVTEDNKIARFMPADFKQIKEGQEAFVFEMTEIDQEIKNPLEVREILEF